MKELFDSLNAAGLSNKESQVYIDLLQHGSSQTGKICEHTRIPSSHIYKLLDVLMDKGLVSYKLVNKIKVFEATSPDNLSLLFEEKEKEVKQKKERLLAGISTLKKIPLEKDKFSDFQYFQGINGIKSLFTIIINSWKTGDEYYIASAPSDAFEKLEGFFMDVVLKKKKQDKIRLKILVNKNSKEFGEKRKKEPLTEVKYLDIDTSTEYGVLNNYFFIVNYGKNPYGILIEDEAFANTYKAFFDILWKNADEM